MCYRDKEVKDEDYFFSASMMALPRLGKNHKVEMAGILDIRGGKIYSYDD